MMAMIINKHHAMASHESSFLQFQSPGLENMAFVFRSKQSQPSSTTTPGPGQYRLAVKQNSPTHATAPFNQTSPRRIWKENMLPGPGAYTIEEARGKERVIVKNCGNAFGLFQTPIESANFKSHSKRFQNNQQQLPGPGQYSVDVEKQVRCRTSEKHNSLHKYLQKSRALNVNQDEVGLLAIGEGGQKGRDISAQSQHGKQEKKTVPFASKQERYKPVRPQTSLGPGSYEVSQAKQQKQSINRRKVTQSINKFKKTQPQCLIKQQVLQAKQSPEDSKNKPSKGWQGGRKDDFFGSTVSRFASGVVKDNTPGPGQYQVLSVKTTPASHLPLKKPAFGRSSQESQMREIFISPFHTEDAPNERPKVNKKKSVDGCFLFKEPRFKKISPNDSNQYQAPSSAQLFLGKQNKGREPEAKKQYKPTCRLVIKKQIEKKNNMDDRPLSYATEAFTISAKNKYKCQMNAPFFSHVARFDEAAPSASTQFENLYSQQAIATESKETEASFKSRPSKPKGIMDSKNPRFNYTQDTCQLSPFSYDPVRPKGKQFNRLFL